MLRHGDWSPNRCPDKWIIRISEVRISKARLYAINALIKISGEQSTIFLMYVSCLVKFVLWLSTKWPCTHMKKQTNSPIIQAIPWTLILINTSAYQSPLYTLYSRASKQRPHGYGLSHIKENSINQLIDTNYFSQYVKKFQQQRVTENEHTYWYCLRFVFVCNSWSICIRI